MDGNDIVASPRKGRERRGIEKSPNMLSPTRLVPTQSDLVMKNFLQLELQQQKDILVKNPSLISQTISTNQNTLLFLSVQADNYQLSKLLLDNFSNPNHQNKFKETPLHKAIEIGNHKMINLLLENGANPNIQQEFGETPMHIAASKGDYKVLKLLLLFHADPMILSNDGFSAEDYASERGYQKCVDVLSKASNESSLSMNKKNNFILNNINNNCNLVYNKGTGSKESCKSIKSEGILKKSIIADIEDGNNPNVNYWSSCQMANGMERTPVNHRSSKKIKYRVYSDNRSRDNNYYTNLDNLNNNNNNNMGSFSSCGNEFFNNILNNNEIKNNNDDNNIVYVSSINDYDNNIYILNSKDNEEKITFNQNSGLTQSKPPFSLADINSTKSSTNQVFNFANAKLNSISFCDMSGPLITFHSSRNGIIVDTYTRESTIRVNLKKNNTLKSSRREENTYLEEYQLAEQTAGFKAPTLNLSPNNVITNNNSLPNQERELLDYLASIHLEQYTSLMIKEGFDDVDMLINQMKGKKALCDSDLKKVGIINPGHRARLLIKLQLDAGVFGYKMNELNEEDIFYVSDKEMNEYNLDNHLRELYLWFCEIKLGNLFSNFYYNGYHSVDLMMMQMLSKNPITEDLLEHDLNVNKFGYRLRIMNKLFDESTSYLLKYRLNTINNNVEFEKENDEKSSCKCILM